MSKELDGGSADKPGETTATVKPEAPLPGVPGKNGGPPLPTAAYYARAQHETRATLEAQQAARTAQGATASGTGGLDGAGGTGSGQEGSGGGSGNGGSDSSPADLDGGGTADGQQARAGHEGQGGNHGSGNESASVTVMAPVDQSGNQPGADSPPVGDGGIPVAGTDGIGLDGQPRPGSTIAPDQSETSANLGQQPEVASAAEPSLAMPAAALDGAYGQPDADAGVIGNDGQSDPAGGQGSDGLQRLFGPAGRGSDAGASESGEQEGDGRTALGNRIGAEVSQQGQDDERDGKTPEKQGEDGKDQGSKDQSSVLSPAPEAETGQQGDTSSEASPDQNADDPVAAMEQRIMQALEKRDAERDERDAAREAEHKAEIDQLKTGFDAKLDSVRSEYEAKLDDLKDKLEAASQQSPADNPPDEDSHPGQAKAEQRADRQNVSTREGDPDDSSITQNQGASFDERDTPLETHDSIRATQPHWRRVISAENVSTAGTLASAVNTVAEFSMHATPGGMASLSIMVIGLIGLGLSKAEKRRKEKDDRPDQR